MPRSSFYILLRAFQKSLTADQTSAIVLLVASLMV